MTEEAELLREGSRLYWESVYSDHPGFAPLCPEHQDEDREVEVPVDASLIEDLYAHAFLAGVNHQKQRMLDAIANTKLTRVPDPVDIALRERFRF